MNYTRQYQNKINWQNEPSVSTPINETNLNKMDNALWYMDGALYTISKAIGGGSSARGGIISNVGNNAFTTHVHQRTGESLAENELLILRSDVSGTGNSINVYTSSSSAAGFDLLDLDGESTSITVTTDSVVVLMITDADTDYTAQVLAVIDTAGGVAYSGLGIGKKKTVTNNVIDTDIDLHRAPIVGDRLLVYFDESVQNPTGLKTYNNGVAVTSNLENVTLLYINGGWNILEFKNDGLLYNNCWVRMQNVNVPTTLSGLTDTAIISPSDDQLLVYDNGKWKNKKFIEANVGFPVTELRKIEVDGIVYDTDGMRTYEASNVANNNITLSVLNAYQFVQKVIAINTGAHSGSSSAWNLVISDGMEVANVALKNADGSPFADDIHENELLFVYVDTAGNIARVLGTAGASNEVYGAFNLLSKSVVAESVPYLYRRSGGAVRDVALEHLKKVVGASVAWNQLVEHGDFDATTGWATDSATLSVANNIGTITPNGSAYSRIKRAVLFITGHKYLVSVEYKKTSALATIPIFSERLPDAIATDNASDGVGSFVKKTLISNCIDGTNNYLYVSDGRSSTSTDARYVKNAMCIDLTAMFGTAIADYLYSLEQATAGSGIAKLKEWGFFTKDYYAYNTGALQSVKTSGKKCVGKNQLPLNLATIKSLNTSGTWSGNTYTYYGGKFEVLTDSDNNVIGIKVNGTFTENVSISLFNGTLSANSYILNGCPSDGGVNTYRLRVEKNGSGTYDNDYGSGVSVSISASDTVVCQIYVKAGTYNGIFYPMIRLASVADSSYEPYTKKTYSLSNIELRGLFKLNNGVLYADGDEYTPDGNIKRKYGIVDLGSLEWTFHSASGAYSDYFDTSSIADIKKGVSTVASNMLSYMYMPIPSQSIATSGYDNKVMAVASNSNRFIVCNKNYTDAATFKTAMNGVYLIYELATSTTETTTPYNETMLVDGDGTEEFLDSRDIPVPVGHESGYNQAIKGLPTAPTADGNYKLRCTVTNGQPSYSWVSDT